METMHAVVAYGHRSFKYEEIDRPVAGVNEVVAKILAAGVCAGDRKLYDGGHILWRLDFPFVPGHEFIGEVVELGPGAEQKYNLRIGDHAIAEITTPCGTCYYCRRGLYLHCENARFYGSSRNGGWAEYMKWVDGSIVWKVPKLEPSWSGALIEPLACALHIISKAKVQMGDSLVISGMGGIGLLAVQALRRLAPSRIIALDVRDSALEMARNCGADLTINPAREDAVKAVQGLTERGCDIYIEISGSSSAIEPGIMMLRKAGRLVVFGVYAEKSAIDFTYVSDIKELELIGVHCSPNTYPLAIKYLAEGFVDPTKVVTHVLRLAEFRQGIGINDQSGDKPRAKVVLIP